MLCRLRDLSKDSQLSLAQPARAECARNGIPFIVSHDLALARELQADAVQFGKADGKLNELEYLAGQGMPFGYSAHSLEEAESALDAGAAWVFLGPVFATPQKLQYGPPLGLDLVSTALRLNRAGKLVFIGGINRETLPGLLARGARRVAAIAALQQDVDPWKAAEYFARQLNDASAHDATDGTQT